MSRMSQDEMIALITKNVAAALAGANTTPAPAPAPSPAKADGRKGRKLSDEHKAKMAAGRAASRAAKTGKPVAAVAKATPVPAVAPVVSAPVARANGKTPKVAYSSDTFNGNGCTLVFSKFKGRKRNYAKISSPNDARMNVYASYETLRELAQVLRSDAARDILAYLADCHDVEDDSDEG